MKFRFKIQPYQTDAVESIIRIFTGQKHREMHSYIRDLGDSPKSVDTQTSIGSFEDIAEHGFKNAELELSDEELLANIHRMQTFNNIKLSSKLIKELGRCSLDIEMETGTGKTYVYIKTMFELNKRYGWSKYIIVVPSIAIREGVKKSFEMMQDHFMEYYGKKARYFIYNSGNLTDLDNFSANAGIHVMIINTQAFATSLKEGAKNKESRIIYSKRDEFASRRPIDVISANRPIVILDEPQKMGGEVTQKALKNFNPLFCLNYSATHAKQHNLVYVLDALDAYNKKLVKKIIVKGFEVKNLRGTDKYLYLEDFILASNKPPRARLEIEINYNKSINRETRILGVGDDLFYKSNEMEQYRGFMISEIDPVRNLITFANGETISRGEVKGDVSEQDMRRIQIRETIVSHFEKEEQLFNKGIKTLSLFFIDEVAKYRLYNELNEEQLGEYGKMFEQEYTAVLNERLSLFDSDYRDYLLRHPATAVHKGYFSIDKKGHAVDSSVKRGTSESDDISAYDLILKNKERLLSFEEPTRFIFSHSALREGWDNPNVFQICTLKHSDSTTMKRQEVGRGLRLCVNQSGNRMDTETVGEREVHLINQLTVIASESYKTFVGDLQKQIQEVLYDRPTKATMDYFKGKTIFVEGEPTVLDEKASKHIYAYLLKNDYIDDDDNVTDKYKTAVAEGSLVELPYGLQPFETGIHTLIQAVFDEKAVTGMFEDGNKPAIRSNDLNDNFYKKEFQELWNTINHKYAYTVDFSSEELISKAVNHIEEKLFVTRLQYTTSMGEQKEELSQHDLERGSGFGSIQTRTQELKHAHTASIKYDLIGKIASGTKLTRRTVALILRQIDPHRLAMFKNNPEEFISKVTRLINEQKATMIVNKISYNTTDDSYDSSIFTAGNFAHRYEKAFRAKHHIQDFVLTDGTADESVEKRFAKQLDDAYEVSVYAKLPTGFKIPTPVGNYSPDWAIAFKEGTVKHIFFVAETKGSLESLELREIEKAKISCAKTLFSQISDDKVKYHEVRNYEDLLAVMEKV